MHALRGKDQEDGLDPQVRQSTRCHTVDAPGDGDDTGEPAVRSNYGAQPAPKRSTPKSAD
jgi:hypothetical protein